MACDVVEMASGVPLVWARRDGVGEPVAAVVPVDVAGLSSTVSAAAFVLVPLSALPVSLLVASTCACCSAVAGGCIASAMAGIGNVVLTMEVHVIAQIR